MAGWERFFVCFFDDAQEGMKGGSIALHGWVLSVENNDDYQEKKSMKLPEKQFCTSAMSRMRMRND